MKQEKIKSNRITLSPDYTRENIPALDIRNGNTKTRPISPPKITSKSNTSTTSEKQTVIAKYSLQFKLMLVISLVITIALSVMIALATYFFKDDNTKRIQENNLEIVRIVNAKVFSDLVTEINKGKTLLALKQKFNTDDQKKFFIDQYFNNDNSFIYLGVYKKSETNVEVVDSIYNEKFLQKYSLTEGDIALPIKNNLTYFSKSFDGVPTISNTSQGSQEASIAISIPMEEGGSSEFIIIILLKSDLILEAFKKSGMNTTYMVNEDGSVLAHPDMSRRRG